MTSSHRKPVLTKHGRKGKVITFSLEKKESFVNGFQKRKKERKSRGSERKKKMDKRFRDEVKKDAKETMRRHVKTVEQVCNSSQESKAGKTRLEDLKTTGSAPKIIRYDGGVSSENTSHPWSMPCSVKIADSI